MKRSRVVESHVRNNYFPSKTESPLAYSGIIPDCKGKSILLISSFPMEHTHKVWQSLINNRYKILDFYIF